MSEIEANEDEVTITTLAYRPWCVSVPLVISLARAGQNYPEWVSIRALNITHEYMLSRHNQGRPFITGFVRCALTADMVTRPGVITVEFYNRTVLDEGLTFAKPGGLMTELTFVAKKLMKGFGEREAVVDAHGWVNHLALAPLHAKA